MTWLHEMAQRAGGCSVGLLTLSIYGTADGLLTSCRQATESSPASTVNVADITAGQWGAFIGAGLLFDIIRGYTPRPGRMGRRLRENMKTIVLCTYSAQRISQDVGWIAKVRCRGSCRLDGAYSAACRDTDWVRRQARRRQ